MTLSSIIYKYIIPSGSYMFLYDKDGTKYKVGRITIKTKTVHLYSDAGWDCLVGFDTTAFKYLGHGTDFKNITLVIEDSTISTEELLGKVAVDNVSKCSCELYGPNGLMAIGCTCGHTKRYSSVG